jgi:N-acyl-D-aspartate/D-glutamate deacylase
MATVLRSMVNEGALGLSTSVVWTHNDGEGRPVPSRAADHEEFVALASVLRDLPGTTLEIAPQTGAFSDAALETMIAMSAAARRPMIWNLFQPSPSNPELWQSQLAASDRAAAADAELIALLMTEPMEVRMSFVSGFAVDAIPGWGDVLRLPTGERIAALNDPATRQRLRGAAETAKIPQTSLANVIHRWPALTVTEVFSAENERWLGRTVAEIAAERGTDAFDTVIDLVVADRLRTGLHPPRRDDDAEAWELRSGLWYDNRTLVGGSDAGAHVDVMCMSNFPTKWLGRLGRQPELGTISQAIRELTAVPAAIFGIRDRGRIAPGYRADLVLFDPERIDAGPLRLVDDLPGGALRLVSDAVGLKAVFVNGVQTRDDGRPTGELPGSVIRSGRDTGGDLRRRAPAG